jgi:hypothetical protein
MNANQIHIRAFELRTKLFNLVNEIKALQLEAHNAGLDDDHGDLDQVACKLATIHDELPDAFIAATREN